MKQKKKENRQTLLIVLILVLVIAIAVVIFALSQQSLHYSDQTIARVDRILAQYGK